MLPVQIAVAGREKALSELALPMHLATLVEKLSGQPTDWEVEIGFGKGKYLLEQAALRPEVAFLGIEVASKYYRIVRDRAARRGLENLVLVRGEALYLLTSILPERFAGAVHVYFPDPWPKSRHHARRLFDPESVDLVLRLLKPGGSVSFATDYLEYGELVKELLEAHPALEVECDPPGSIGEPRTHYEDKYRREGRAILRLEARLEARGEEGRDLFHPAGGVGVLAANAPVAAAEPGEPDREAAS